MRIGAGRAFAGFAASAALYFIYKYIFLCRRLFIKFVFAGKYGQRACLCRKDV